MLLELLELLAEQPDVFALDEFDSFAASTLERVFAFEVFALFARFLPNIRHLLNLQSIRFAVLVCAEIKEKY